MATLSTILDRCYQRTGDYISEAVTTAINADNLVVSTNFGKHWAVDDACNRQWIYFTDKANAGVERRISDYSNSSTQITVQGAALSDDAADLATVEIHRYERANLIRAINQAARKTYPALFRIATDTSMSTGNILPNPSFDDWSATTSPDYWTTLSSVTATASTTAGTYRYGGKSAKVTASGASGYMALTSDVFPQLLDLEGHTVSVYVWCNPQTANDGVIQIYTKQADGTEQTDLVSTTSNPAGEYTLLKLENQTLNDDLDEVQIRLTVTTSGQYAYFDNVRIKGLDASRIILPLIFQNPSSAVKSVEIQSTNTQEYPTDDNLSYARFTPLFGWNTEDDATTKYLILPNVTNQRLLKIKGIAPLEDTLSSATDTMTIEDPHLDVLVEMAVSILYDMESGSPSAGDRAFLVAESFRYRANYEDMKRKLRMPKPQAQTRFRSGIV